LTEANTAFNNALEKGKGLKSEYAKLYWQRVFQQLQEALKAVKSNQGVSSPQTQTAKQQINPQADSLWQKGLKLLEQGNFPEAEKAIRQAISVDPHQPEYHYHLGMSLHPQGLFAEAAEAFKAAIALKPDWGQALNGLGAMYTQIGLYPEAEDAYRKLIALNPTEGYSYYNLGIILEKRGLIEEAKEPYRQAITLKPNIAMAYNNLGSILFKEGATEEAFSLFKQAIALEPNCVEAYRNLGSYFLNKRMFLQAEQTYRHCISLRPNDPDIHFELAIVFNNQLLMKPAEIAYRRALALKPDHAKVHYNLASLLLMQGDLSQGFAEHEWRWQSQPMFAPKIAQPAWDGSNPEGKTILVVYEQGFGDNLQFIRYAPLLSRLGAQVKLTCVQGLVRLLAMVEGITEVIPLSETVVCDCDCYVPIMSLPYLFGTTMATIPSQVPYIKLNSHNQTHLPAAVESPHEDLKVGIVWASGMRYYDANLFRIYQQKSAPLEMFMQFLELPKVKLYSLQLGKDAQEIQKYLDNPRVVDLSPHIKDFYNTAELIQQLDLVISVDTAVAHLAGAMGKPVWVLLPFSADWRWFLGRKDSPWYPTMRLFRQAKRGDWGLVFAEVQQALEFSTSISN